LTDLIDANIDISCQGISNAKRTNVPALHPPLNRNLLSMQPQISFWRYKQPQHNKPKAIAVQLRPPIDNTEP